MFGVSLILYLQDAYSPNGCSNWLLAFGALMRSNQKNPSAGSVFLNKKSTVKGRSLLAKWCRALVRCAGLKSFLKSQTDMGAGDGCVTGNSGDVDELPDGIPGSVELLAQGQAAWRPLPHRPLCG